MMKADKLFEQQWLSSQRFIESVKARADKKRTFTQRLADWSTGIFGSFTFLMVNVMWFAGWLVVNLGWVNGIKPFDPFPFTLLTTTVSIEAIILAIFVLMSQNRTNQIYDLREETDLHIDVIAEEELTKALQLLAKIAEKQGIDVSRDQVLRQMVKPTDTVRIERTLEEEINRPLKLVDKEHGVL